MSRPSSGRGFGVTPVEITSKKRLPSYGGGARNYAIMEEDISISIERNPFFYFIVFVSFDLLPHVNL